MSKILDIKAREVLDSRGNPTVEVSLMTKDGQFSAMVPSGASTGIHEAWELRDGGKRYGGKGVLTAVANVNSAIAKKIKGHSVLDQYAMDTLLCQLDGTPNKKKLGANAILGVSMAVARAGAAASGAPLYAHIGKLAKKKQFLLPVPSFNVINGGKHAGNQIDFQEYMLLPIGASSFSQALRMGAETYQVLKGILREKHGVNAVNVGDEGGFAPPLTTIEQPLEVLTQAIQQAGYSGKIKIGMDVAASSFYANGTYNVEGKAMLPGQLQLRYEALVKKYDIVTIEDPFAEDDFNAFKNINASIGKNIQIVGDDLLVTNVERIRLALKHNACNALLLKVNQIGTVTESLAAAQLARDNSWGVMVSHRSGETEDSFIADLSVGICSGQIKSGAPCRSERLAKYNQLLRIEEQLGKKAKYAGKNFRSGA
ncbi:phosphopyruvate hydratase [Candidatus Woesearchaeota archaeon]|nr:phosphopyruvate hydratase [Candidatus Woesearchaeota archaeon]